MTTFLNGVCKPKNRKWRKNSSTSFLRMQKFSWLQMVVARWTWENMHSENTMWCSCRKHSLGKSKFYFISLDLKLTSLDLNVTFHNFCIKQNAFIGNKAIGKDNIIFNARFFFTANGIEEDFSDGWSFFIITNHQIRCTKVKFKLVMF